MFVIYIGKYLRPSGELYNGIKASFNGLKIPRNSFINEENVRP